MRHNYKEIPLEVLGDGRPTRIGIEAFMRELEPTPYSSWNSEVLQALFPMGERLLQLIEGTTGDKACAYFASPA